MLLNPVELEKYLAVAVPSTTVVSAARGFTISIPFIGVYATVEAVPDICDRILVFVPSAEFIVAKFF